MAADRSPSLSAAFTAAGRVLLDHPVAVVSAYLLVLGVVPVARVPFLLALAGAVGLLSSMGRIEPLVEALVESGDALAGDGGAGDGGLGGGFGDGFGAGTGGADPQLPPALRDAIEGVLVPEVGVLLLVGFLVTLVVALLVQSVASAVSYGTVWAAIDDRPALVDGVASAGRWRSYLGLVLVRVAVVVLAVAIPLAVGLLLGGAAGLAVGGLLALVGLVVVLAALLLLAFAGPAVVVDGVGAVQAIRRSAGFVRRNLGVTVAFALVALGTYVGASILVGALNLAGAGRLGAVVLSLAVVPLLDAFATAIYAGRGLPPDDRAPIVARVRGALRGGVRELWGFLVGHPVANLAGALCIAAGVAVGYAFTAPMGVTLPPPEDVSLVFGAVPIGPFANIAANNWLVAAGTAFGGLAFGVPAAASLLFNGVLIGALAGVFDRTAFLALVAPHGVLELPAIAVAGGLGLHLGVVGWRAVRGRADAVDVAAELRRATWVLVGLALVLVAASFVEAFLTPRIAAYVLG